MSPRAHRRKGHSMILRTPRPSGPPPARRGLAGRHRHGGRLAWRRGCRQGRSGQKRRVVDVPPAAVPEDVGEVALHHRRHLVHREVAPGLGGQRGRPGVADAARDDPVVPGQVAVRVQGEPVHGDAPGHPRADRADLAIRAAVVTGHPGAAAPGHAPGGDAELRARPDHGLLERAHVGHDIQWLAQLDDRVPGQLPGAVPGDLAAAVHVDDRRSRIAERPVGCCRALAGRVHRLVLEQQAAVRNLVGHPPGMHAPLQVPGLAVLHRGGAELKVEEVTHFSQLTPGQATVIPAWRPASAGSSAGTAEPAPRRRQDNGMVIDKAELRSMSRAERHELAALLAELDEPAATARQREPVRPDPYRIDPVLARERPLALLVSAGCCVVLAGWIVLLAATLPHQFDAHHWRAVWVNFDVFLLAAFTATAWAIWRQRQVLILLLVLIGTMLCCDAWFDVGTSLATRGFTISLLSAVFAELPLAFLAFAGARRLLRATVAAGILAGARAQFGQAAQVGRVAQVG